MLGLKYHGTGIDGTYPCSTLLASMVRLAFGHATLPFGSAALGGGHLRNGTVWFPSKHNRTTAVIVEVRIDWQQGIKSLAHEVEK